MLRKILLGLAVVIAGILIAAAFQPADFHVSRSTLVSASPAALFAEVNELPRWQGWSPFEKLDPAMKRSFAGPAAGVGAVYAWEGNSEAGTGRMTVTESRPVERVVVRLDFLKPLEGTSHATFTFVPEGGQTRVTWAMAGHNGYLGKLFCLFVNIDKTVGGQFEEGLATLKAKVEPKG
jgi:hypothetical protein